MNTSSNNKPTRAAFVNVTEAVVNGSLYSNTENSAKNLKQYNNENNAKPLVRKNITNVKQQRIINKPIKKEDNNNKENSLDYNINTIFDEESTKEFDIFKKELRTNKTFTSKQIDDLFSKEKKKQ